MAATADPEAVQQVIDIIGGEHPRELIERALVDKGNDVFSVVNGFFDQANFFKKYELTWDETAFGSSREGDEHATVPADDLPSFTIFPADNAQVINGLDPNDYPPVPPSSRPPSRINNRTPISKAVEMTTGDLKTTAPNSKDEEDEQMRQALNESLNTSGVQSPQPYRPHSGLPPPPHPQQSGVTPVDDSAPYFGPANRTDYDPEKWAMVPSKRREPDPDPGRRKRNPETPVFLRCRSDGGWNTHRLGGILTILHSIPAVRNALLRIGKQPDYGYGHNPEWWKGARILSPELEAAKAAEDDDWAPAVYPPFTDELHRLIAFLDSTERSYGTADTLAECRMACEPSGDRERDFFEDLEKSPEQSATVFRTKVEIGPLSGDSQPGDPQPEDSQPNQTFFTLLDDHTQKENLAMAENLYSIWDMIFYTDASEDPGTAKMAVITTAADVIVYRSSTEDGWPKAIDVPETFYIDRYVAAHREEMKQLQVDIAKVNSALKKCQEWEQRETVWVNPESGKVADLRVMNKAAISRCQQLISRIKNRAFYRAHQTVVAEGTSDGFYLPSHEGEPSLEPEEAKVIAFYEGRIQQVEASQARIERIMNDMILPLRRELDKLSRLLSSRLTCPSPIPRWNPTHKYTLRGVVNDASAIFIRKRETSLMELDDDAAPGEQWWKLWCDPSNDHAVFSETVDFAGVTREACGDGSKPILIYASEKAMDETLEPLSDALKTFAKFDNRYFKQEVTAAATEEHSNAMKEMSYTSTLRGAGIKKARSDSMDSMATNQASMGDFDDEIRDAAFGQSEDVLPGGVSEETLDYGNNTENLVDVSLDEAPTAGSPKGLAPVKEIHEMQERGSTGFISGADLDRT